MQLFALVFVCVFEQFFIYSLDSGEYSTSFFSTRIAKQKISLETLGDDDQSHTDTLLVLVSVFPHYTQQLSLDQSSSQWLCLFTIVVIFSFFSSFFSFSFSLTAANHSTRVVVAEVACLSWLLAANKQLAVLSIRSLSLSVWKLWFVSLARSHSLSQSTRADCCRC